MAKALVTGATSGIGRAIAIALQRAGHDVTAVGRQPEALAELAERGMTPLRLDLVDGQAVKAALADGDFDILINNAGVISPLVAFCDSDPDDTDRLVSINLTSTLRVTRMVAPGMRERGRGHIFFTGSTAGHGPFANLAAYGATKAALGSFAQALRLEMGGYGVRVTEIVAGRVQTNLYGDILSVDARADMYAGAQAVQPDDLAAMVLAALSLPKSANVSRMDILPTFQASGTGNSRRNER
ncbi:SDR family oxidoreductase [Devosia sp. SL43]|uniref:SDR family oxidoreductase n=1 Tax=Devosia sp. SL43 TaxID=2806348 RepID=UPI001F1F2178|nr:SDR family oxidoreductase [Devosia sp. SL43]UJW86533.1 SDR family oxidoreductase [Devosia sp. SL43]